MRLGLILALTCVLAASAGSAWAQVPTTWIDLYEGVAPNDEVGAPIELYDSIIEGYLIVLENPLLAGQDWQNDRSLWSDVVQFYETGNGEYDQKHFAQLISDPAWDYILPVLCPREPNELIYWDYVVEDANGYAEYIPRLIPGTNHIGPGQNLDGDFGYKIHSDGDIPEPGSLMVLLTGLVPLGACLRRRAR
jgi:hypothetical protein